MPGGAVPNSTGKFLCPGTPSLTARENFCAWGRRPQQRGEIFVPGDAVPNNTGKFLYPGTPSLTTKIFPSLFFISENKKSGVFFLAAEHFGNIFVPSRLFLIAKGAESFCQIIVGRGMVRLQFGGDLEIRQSLVVIF